MSPRRTRPRMLDVAVVIFCIACIAAPFVASSSAVERSVLESAGDVDQRVLQSGVISMPLDGSFGSGCDGTVTGGISWDLYTTSDKGMKLLISSDRNPAMRDAANSVDIADYPDDPSAWSVASGDRRFGFSVAGDVALPRYDQGEKWRGFDGRTPIEIGRRMSPIGMERTTLRLRAAYGSGLASNARCTSDIMATAVVNL